MPSVAPHGAKVNEMAFHEAEDYTNIVYEGTVMSAPTLNSSGQFETIVIQLDRQMTDSMDGTRKRSFFLTATSRVRKVLNSKNEYAIMVPSF